MIGVELRRALGRLATVVASVEDALAKYPPANMDNGLDYNGLAYRERQLVYNDTPLHKLPVSTRLEAASLIPELIYLIQSLEGECTNSIDAITGDIEQALHYLG